jgi:hypothetical protein
MLITARAWWMVGRRCRDYRPQPVNLALFRRWVRQFDAVDRPYATELVSRIKYFSEADVRRALVRQNAALLKKLQGSGVGLDRVIYVQVDEAGSSSPVMLNILRDAVGLDRSEAHFLDSRDVFGLNDLTNALGAGAIIYVDDFIGTGNQICRSRDFSAEYVVGNFSEFVLAPAICEEAYYEFGPRGITAYADHLHSKADRPLHENGTLLPEEVRERLRRYCLAMDPRWGLGYKQLATMVVMYRNSPNTTPMLFRGSRDQQPLAGLFPRVTDLPGASKSETA